MVTLCAILGIAYGTYFHHYHLPAQLIWDEGYHIPSAEKYLHGIMFMEPHPPLGKLFLSLGEWLIHPNPDIDPQIFLQTDFIEHLPPNFSFLGVRLFPSLLATLSALLFFKILWQLYSLTTASKTSLGQTTPKDYSPLLFPLIFTSLYLFENATIVQSRAAMLDAVQLFFIFTAICYFLSRLTQSKNSFTHYFILGLWVGFATAVKLNSLILLFLFPALWFYPYYQSSLGIKVKTLMLPLVSKGFSFLSGILLIFCLSYYIHFSLGKTVLENDYQASEQTITIVEQERSHYLTHFFTQMFEHVKYIQRYEQGVPSSHEPGSPATAWPFGHKSIPYLKQSNPQSGTVQFLYLQGNPIIWLLALIGVLLTLSQIIAGIFFSAQTGNKAHRYLNILFTLMYFSYLFVMFNLGRVMYLYHYLIPLFWGTWLFFMQFVHIFQNRIKTRNKLFYAMTFILLAEILFCYLYFAPLSYFYPLEVNDLMQRQWMDFWHLDLNPGG